MALSPAIFGAFLKLLSARGKPSHTLESLYQSLIKSPVSCKSTIKMAASPNPAGSLEDRISKPNAAADPTAQSISAWEEDAATPAEANEAKDDKSGAADAQVDGATDADEGSALHEPQYAVEVKLSDIQADANSPLYSIGSFEELGM
jgi:hypothetical protein